MINLIVAVDENYMIGKKNNLPWKIKEDLDNFKKITLGCPIIMGRKTFESLPGILPKRQHIVISNNYKDLIFTKEKKEQIFICSSVEESIKKGYQLLDNDFSKKIFVIGGESIYNEFMNKNLVDKVFISKIKMAVEPDNTSKYFLFKNWENNFLISFQEEYKDFLFQIFEKKMDLKNERKNSIISQI